MYSIAQIDLEAGPIRLDVPEVGDRYYVLQFVDAWTNNFAYVGKRATGSGAGSFLLVPPTWQGEAGAGETVIRFPTRVATIVGRWAVDGDDDLATVAALQDQLTLTPLNPDGELGGLPEPHPHVPDELLWYEKLRVWMLAFPPSFDDEGFARRFERLGILDDTTPFADAHPDHVDALTKGMATGRERMEAALVSNAAPVVNGWRQTLHLFDYNLDHFEIGTIDTDEWKISDRPTSYLVRALAARAGLWGNHGYEAAYSITYLDGSGQALDGSQHRYSIRFEVPPPVDAFWSITMYDLPNFFLVDNPIDRYSIGDRTPGLVFGDDGSLTLLIQHDAPGIDEEANWLPAPDAPFRPVMRLYMPREAVLDGSYVIPPITIAD